MDHDRLEIALAVGRTAEFRRQATGGAGPVADQAALHGLLAKVRDLGLPLLSVRRIDPEP